MKIVSENPELLDEIYTSLTEDFDLKIEKLQKEGIGGEQGNIWHTTGLILAHVATIVTIVGYLEGKVKEGYYVSFRKDETTQMSYDEFKALDTGSQDKILDTYETLIIQK